MRTLKRTGWAGASGLAAAVVFMLVRQQPVPPTNPSPSAPAAATSPGDQTAQGTVAPARMRVRHPAFAAPTAPDSVTVTPEGGGPPARMVRVKPDQTLATVSGVAITLKDSMPLPSEKANAGQLMSAERCRFLLNRALEREVTFQAARGQGLELTAAQRQRLANSA